MVPQSVDASRALAHQHIHILSSEHDAAGLLILIFHRLGADRIVLLPLHVEARESPLI